MGSWEELSRAVLGALAELVRAARGNVVCVRPGKLARRAGLAATPTVLAQINGAILRPLEELGQLERWTGRRRHKYLLRRGSELWRILERGDLPRSFEELLEELRRLSSGGDDNT